ncbi:hypothetical protein GH882_06945 [Bacillus thuringiensis]|nr:hypothetical protein [Bacillus thuringiensis]
MKLGKQIIFKELQKMHSPLHKPFPYRATAKLQRDLKSKFTEDDCINADFNHYWMHTAATLNSVLNGNEQNITFQQYRFLETEIVNYPILYRDFISYEKTRKLLLYYLTE